MRQGLPDLLCDERHERVQQLERLCEDIEQDFLRAESGGLVGAIETRLREFDIPVAVGVPDKVVYFICGYAELILVDILVDLAHKGVELGEYPLVLELKLVRQLVFVYGEVHHDEAAGVPDLVGKVAHGLAALVVVAHVVSGAVAGYDIEAQRVGAVGIDDGNGIDAVAEALAHLAALRVADEAVEQHGVERYLVHVLHAGEYHARDPEEQYVISCDEHVGRIEILELGRLVGPAES